MHFMSEARVPILQRAAPEWDAKQSWRLRQSGDREFRLSSAYRAENLHNALDKMSVFVPSHLKAMVMQIPGFQAGVAPESLLCFRMASRAGGALLELGIREQRRCPFATHALLGATGPAEMQEMAEDLLTERKVSSHAFDATSQEHIDTYRSVDELTS